MIIRSTQHYYNNDILLHIIVCKIDASIIFQGSLLVLITCMLISILTWVCIMTVVSILIMFYPNSSTDNGVHLVWHCHPLHSYLCGGGRKGSGEYSANALFCARIVARQSDCSILIPLGFATFALVLTLWRSVVNVQHLTMHKEGSNHGSLKAFRNTFASGEQLKHSLLLYSILR